MNEREWSGFPSYQPDLPFDFRAEGGGIRSPLKITNGPFSATVGQVVEQPRLERLQRALLFAEEVGLRLARSLPFQRGAIECVNGDGFVVSFMQRQLCRRRRIRRYRRGRSAALSWGAFMSAKTACNASRLAWMSENTNWPTPLWIAPTPPRSKSHHSPPNAPDWSTSSPTTKNSQPRCYPPPCHPIRASNPCTGC